MASYRQPRRRTCASHLAPYDDAAAVQPSLWLWAGDSNVIDEPAMAQIDCNCAQMISANGLGHNGYAYKLYNIFTYADMQSWIDSWMMHFRIIRSDQWTCLGQYEIINYQFGYHMYMDNLGSFWGQYADISDDHTWFSQPPLFLRVVFNSTAGGDLPGNAWALCCFAVFVANTYGWCFADTRKFGSSHFVAHIRLEASISCSGPWHHMMATDQKTSSLIVGARSSGWTRNYVTASSSPTLASLNFISISIVTLMLCGAKRATVSHSITTLMIAMGSGVSLRTCILRIKLDLLLWQLLRHHHMVDLLLSILWLIWQWLRHHHMLIFDLRRPQIRYQ